MDCSKENVFANSSKTASSTQTPAVLVVANDDIPSRLLLPFVEASRRRTGGRTGATHNLPTPTVIAESIEQAIRSPMHPVYSKIEPTSEHETDVIIREFSDIMGDHVLGSVDDKMKWINFPVGSRGVSGLFDVFMGFGSERTEGGGLVFSDMACVSRKINF